jgi:hypothetical protein
MDLMESCELAKSRGDYAFIWTIINLEPWPNVVRNDQLLMMWADTCFHLMMWDKLLADYAFRALAERDAGAAILRATVLMGKKEWEAVISVLSRFRTLAPDALSLSIFLSLCSEAQIRMGNYTNARKLAREACDSAVAIGVRVGEAFVLYGWTEDLCGELKSAEIAYTQAIEAGECSPSTFAVRSRLRRSLQNWEGAASDAVVAFAYAGSVEDSWPNPLIAVIYEYNTISTLFGYSSATLDELCRVCLMRSWHDFEFCRNSIDGLWSCVAAVGAVHSHPKYRQLANDHVRAVKELLSKLNVSDRRYVCGTSWTAWAESV